jgi:hypothetical protein
MCLLNIWNWFEGKKLKNLEKQVRKSVEYYKQKLQGESGGSSKDYNTKRNANFILRKVLGYPACKGISKKVFPHV